MCKIFNFLKLSHFFGKPKKESVLDSNTVSEVVEKSSAESLDTAKLCALQDAIYVQNGVIRAKYPIVCCGDITAFKK